ncbi:MAG: ADP-ribosylation factor-directed GTPase activating protein isoform b [Pirellula sp.]
MLASFKIKRNGPSIACTAVAIVACNALGGCQPQIHQPPQAMQVVDADSIASMIDTTLQYNRSRRVLSVDRNAAWQVAHGAVAYGKDLKLQVEGKEVSALDYLFQGGQMRGWELSTGPVLASTKRPSVQAYVEAGSYVGQGHVDQFLGYLSQAALPLDTPIQIEDQTLTLEDWGRSAQNELPNNPYREYSWTLIALTNLFPNDVTWTAGDGNPWTLESVAEFEAKQDIAESPCGGMHRLMGLAHTVRYCRNRQIPFQGGWLAAKQVVEQAIETIRKYQNSDGTFSANYTVRPGTSADLSTRIGTTGHTLEFLAYALEPKQLKEPWMERAVVRLCELLDSASEVELECGGLYHGLSGLRIYRDRLRNVESGR